MSEGRKKGPAPADTLAGTGLAALAGGFLSAALGIPSSTALWNWYDSPGLTPALLAGVLLVQAAVLLVRSRGGRGVEDAGAGWVERARSWGAGRVLLALVFCVGFAVLMGRVPFGVLVAAFVFCMTLAFRGLDPLRAALLALGTAVGVTVVFGRLFFVPLP